MYLFVSKGVKNELFIISPLSQQIMRDVFTKSGKIRMTSDFPSYAEISTDMVIHINI